MGGGSSKMAHSRKTRSDLKYFLQGCIASFFLYLETLLPDLRTHVHFETIHSFSKYIVRTYFVSDTELSEEQEAVDLILSS